MNFLSAAQSVKPLEGRMVEGHVSLLLGEG